MRVFSLLLVTAAALIGFVQLYSAQRCLRDTDDHYRRLGIAREADASEVRKAYRRRSLALHPDKALSRSRLSRALHAAVCGPADESAEFIRLSEASEVLTNAEKRRQYDAQLALEDARRSAVAREQRRAPGSSVFDLDAMRWALRRADAFGAAVPARERAAALARAFAPLLSWEGFKFALFALAILALLVECAGPAARQLVGVLCAPFVSARRLVGGDAAAGLADADRQRRMAEARERQQAALEARVSEQKRKPPARRRAPEPAPSAARAGTGRTLGHGPGLGAGALG